MSDTASGKARARAATATLSALFALIFLAELLVLPPIANEQLASAVEVLRKPVASLAAAAVVLAAAFWQRRWPLAVALGLLAVMVGAAIAPGVYYMVTTNEARALLSQTSPWQPTELTSSATGEAHNNPDALGRASITWAGNDFALALRSLTGTTQQGLYWNAGGPNSHYVFRARIDDHHGGTVVTCPLLFGIVDNRTYDTFRLQSDGRGHTIATAYEIRPNGAALLGGFHGYTLDSTDPLPYVGTWNILTPSERTQSTLMIDAVGDRYRFFVNNRLVFSRVIPGHPTHMVALGVTVLANDYPSEAICSYRDVTLKIHG